MAERWREIKAEIEGRPGTPSSLHSLEMEDCFEAACKRIAELEERCAFVDSGPGPRQLGKHFAAAMDELTARRVYEKDEIAQILGEHKQRIAKLSHTLAFAASCIKSGEPWTETCECEIGDVLREGQS